MIGIQAGGAKEETARLSSRQPLGSVKSIAENDGVVDLRLDRGSARFQAITEYIARAHVSLGESPWEPWLCDRQLEHGRVSSPQ